LSPHELTHEHVYSAEAGEPLAETAALPQEEIPAELVNGDLAG